MRCGTVNEGDYHFGKKPSFRWLAAVCSITRPCFSRAMMIEPHPDRASGELGHKAQGVFAKSCSKLLRISSSQLTIS
jgi:hypothetical protein